MVLNETIDGRFVFLRSITPDDAEFSYQIRCEDKNKNTVGQLAGSIEAQRQYIEKQMVTPGDYYFVICRKDGERIGLIGLYNIEGEKAEIGRFVSDGDSVESLEADYLLSSYANLKMGIQVLSFIVYKNNTSHISNQKKRGYVPLKTIVRNGVEAYYYEVQCASDGKKDKIKDLLNKIRV